ncbi:MAG: subtype B tannase [Bacteroidales bacterium]
MKKLTRKIFVALLPGIALPVLAQSQTYDLSFNPDNYTAKTFVLAGKSYPVRAYENLVYVANPVDTTYQKMNIYIPEAYFKGEKINKYDKYSAPIFFPNGIGGYAPAEPQSLTGKKGPRMQPRGDRGTMGNRNTSENRGMNNSEQGNRNPMGGNRPPMEGNGAPRGMMPQQESALLVALSKGYIVASPGARGRSTKNAEGIYTGKAPAGLVDLKAAVRYLKHNDGVMHGDANKIVSNGTSAGGAFSSLLGATGNNPDYLPYLQELGAADGTDNIFAVSAYCPITNLNHADMAYEWQFNGVNSYQKMNFASFDYNVKRTETPKKLTKEQIELSGELKALFPHYLNSVELTDFSGNRLSLDESGNGSFKEWVLSFVKESAQKALDSGVDLSGLKWLTLKKGKVNGVDFDGYVRYLQRQKTPPAFDALDLSTPENQLFGTPEINTRHFTEFSLEHTSVPATIAAPELIKMMNPMDYIGTAASETSRYWRIRHGSKDKDTSLAIPVILATYLQNKGYSVDFALPWDKPHSGDYDLTELFEWMDQVCD